MGSCVEFSHMYIGYCGEKHGITLPFQDKLNWQHMSTMETYEVCFLFFVFTMVCLVTIGSLCVEFFLSLNLQNDSNRIFGCFLVGVGDYSFKSAAESLLLPLLQAADHF